jgi:hypothetical protein
MKTDWYSVHCTHKLESTDWHWLEVVYEAGHIALGAIVKTT